jgi:serine/threonine protein phosphatase PrpC
MVVTCPACGAASRDLEFCDHCNADLVPVTVATPPPFCPLDSQRAIHLTASQLELLSRPEASLTVNAGGLPYRIHWIARALWPRWRSLVQERLAWQAPPLPPCRAHEEETGIWVIAEATGIRSEPWVQAFLLEPLESLHRLAAHLELLSQALEALHAQGLVWLTFDPREVELAPPGVAPLLRFTNLDLAVYPVGRCPERLVVVPAFASPEVCRFQENELGPRTDVFHLALFAYYWLARLLPQGFPGGGLERFQHALPPLRIFAPQLFPGLQHVLTRGLALDPAKRFPTPAVFAAEFRRALARAEERTVSQTPVRWEIGSHTRTGRAKTAVQRANEDYVLVRPFASPQRALVAVADGISSCEVGSGALASLLSCVVLETTFAADGRASTFGVNMLAACKRASEAMLSWALERGHREKLLAGQDLMGTTLTVGWLEGNHLSAGNLGDSRVYLVTAEFVEQLTVDGDMASGLLAAGVPPEEVAELGSASRALRDCVGGCCRSPTGELVVNDKYSRPALSSWSLLPGDVVVLCTDGLVEEGLFLEPMELAAILRPQLDLPAEKLALKLVEAADARQRLPSPREPEGFGDNISCIVIKIVSSQ